ncbi:MAG: hypothetical protein ACRDF0_11820, partial [Candidatus Limnocylindria bacterium]
PSANPNGLDLVTDLDAGDDFHTGGHLAEVRVLLVEERRILLEREGAKKSDPATKTLSTDAPDRPERASEKRPVERRPFVPGGSAASGADPSTVAHAR